MATDELHPETREALQECARWITQVTDLASKGDWPGVQAAIEALNPAIQRDVILALILARTGEEKRERERLWREYAEKASAAPLN